MTVSAGVGGGSVVGVVLGGGGTVVGNAAATPSVVGSLPFTGASHIMVMIAVALVLLVAGLLALGLARRGSQTT